MYKTFMNKIINPYWKTIKETQINVENATFVDKNIQYRKDNNSLQIHIEIWYPLY